MLIVTKTTIAHYGLKHRLVANIAILVCQATYDAPLAFMVLFGEDRQPIKGIVNHDWRKLIIVVTSYGWELTCWSFRLNWYWFISCISHRYIFYSFNKILRLLLTRLHKSSHALSIIHWENLVKHLSLKNLNFKKQLINSLLNVLKILNFAAVFCQVFKPNI